MSALILFVSTFAAVFALGLQSLNVNGRHFVLAAVTSLFIGTANLAILKLLPGPTTLFDVAGYLLGGPFGIVAAMLAHPRIVAWATRPAQLSRAPAPVAQSDEAMRVFIERLLHPEEFGYSVTREVRDAARDVLGLPRCEGSLRGAAASAAAAVDDDGEWQPLSPAECRFFWAVLAAALAVDAAIVVMLIKAVQ